MIELSSSHPNEGSTRAQGVVIQMIVRPERLALAAAGLGTSGAWAPMFAPAQLGQQYVEPRIAGVKGKYPVEPLMESTSCLW